MPKNQPETREGGGLETSIPDNPEAQRARELPVVKKKGRPKNGAAKKAATAWAKRNAEYLRRRSETIEFPEQAIAIWREAGAETEDEKKHGKLRNGIGRPKGFSKRPPMVGESIEKQVYAKVEHDRLFLKPGETLEEVIERWPLPFTFFDPVPPLCPADVDAIRRQELDDERERSREAADGRDGRLLPGMSREA